MSFMETPCVKCAQNIGDHTLRKWNECIGGGTFDMPFGVMDANDAVARAGADNMQQQLGRPDGVLLADQAIVRAMYVDSPMGRIGGVVHEFEQVKIDGPPATVAKVAYIGSNDVLRKYGDLVHGAAHAAANEGRPA